VKLVVSYGYIAREKLPDTIVNITQTSEMQIMWDRLSCCFINRSHVHTHFWDQVTTVKGR